MKDYQRPWWLLVNRSSQLISTVREESEPGQRIFVVKGEPLIQGLAWLTWGPVAALLTVLALTVLAVLFQIKSQGLLVKTVMIVAFVALPALLWLATVLLMARLSEKHLRIERQAEQQECVIRLDQNRGRLSYHTTTHPQEQTVPYEAIRQVRAMRAIGERNGAAMRLVVETDRGPVVLLDEALGAPAQKTDLAREIQSMLDIYAANKQ